MHMADALISPAVGISMYAAAIGTGAYSIKKLKDNMDDKKIPLMGVMGAFVFAAQMLNFTIPGTGSSGHLGGGLLLSVILGPYAGFITMMSILLIQALFFADGGLLALGCNIINMGLFTCFFAYPLIYKKIMKKGFSVKRIFTASILASVAGLQLGSLGVVLETMISGKTDLPFKTFLLYMQLIHLAIGAVEGLATAAIVSYIWKTRSEIMEEDVSDKATGKKSLKKAIVIIASAAVITGGILSWFSSSNPDGLEWSILKAAGTDELKTSGFLHDKASEIQNNTALLPDYDFKNKAQQDADSKNYGKTNNQKEGGIGTVANGGTSVSGLVGGTMTLLLAGATGIIIRIFKKRKNTIGSKV